MTLRELYNAVCATSIPMDAEVRVQENSFGVALEAVEAPRSVPSAAPTPTPPPPPEPPILEDEVEEADA